MLTPPTTNDPALNRFLEEVASTIQDRVRPEEGWTLSDFASSVSEVISDKRDLIDIVTQYDNIEGLSEEMKAEVARLKSDVQDSIDFLSSIESKSAEFAEVMEWWDQNYKVIFDAQEAMSIFGEISAALEGHQGILDQIAAATAVAENVVAEIKATEEAINAAVEAAKTSETNSADAAARANTSETAAGQSAAAAEASATAAAGDAATAAGARDDAVTSADWIRGSALTALAETDASVNAAAARAEAAAAGVDQVVSDASGALAVEIADDLAASQAARSGAESARDQAVGAASQATTKAGEAAADAAEVGEAREFVAGVHESLSPGGATTVILESLANNAMSAASQAGEARDAAQGHADRAATEAGAAAQIAAQEKIAELIGDAPANLDTIYELAAAFAGRGDAIAAIQSALANRVMGNHSSVIASTAPGPGTPTNQVTFVVEGA